MFFLRCLENNFKKYFPKQMLWMTVKFTYFAWKGSVLSRIKKNIKKIEYASK